MARKLAARLPNFCGCMRMQWKSVVVDQRGCGYGTFFNISEISDFSYQNVVQLFPRMWREMTSTDHGNSQTFPKCIVLPSPFPCSFMYCCQCHIICSFKIFRSFVLSLLFYTLDLPHGCCLHWENLQFSPWNPLRLLRIGQNEDI